MNWGSNEQAGAGTGAASELALAHDLMPEAARTDERRQCRQHDENRPLG
jgi:hypothetical protein